MAIKKKRVTPRQKMINLLYVVLMAMLALNISTEVLNGFSIVEESLNRTTANSSSENLSLYKDFEDQMQKNPAKVREWFEKATTVKNMMKIKIIWRPPVLLCWHLAQEKEKNSMKR